MRGIVISNSNESKKDEVLKVVNGSLNNIVKNGFDEELINSVLNSYELRLRKDNLSDGEVIWTRQETHGCTVEI